MDGVGFFLGGVTEFRKYLMTSSANTKGEILSRKELTKLTITSNLNSKNTHTHTQTHYDIMMLAIQVLAWNKHEMCWVKPLSGIPTLLSGPPTVPVFYCHTLLFVYPYCDLFIPFISNLYFTLILCYYTFELN